MGSNLFLACAFLLFFQVTGRAADSPTHTTASRTSILFRDNFDTNTLLHSYRFEVLDTDANGRSITAVQHETSWVGIGFDGVGTRQSVLSCTLPPFPADADTYRIQIHVLQSNWLGVSNLWFGYGLRGSGFIMEPQKNLDGYVVNMASGTGGQRIHFYRYDSGVPWRPHESQFGPVPFSPLNIRKILVEIGRDGTHHVTCTFDTGGLVDKTFVHVDTATHSILSAQPTRLQLRGTASATYTNVDGRIFTDTWLVEAVHAAREPKRRRNR